MLKDKKTKLANKLFNFFILGNVSGMMSAVFLVTLSYLGSCETHLLAGIVPICIKQNGVWKHRFPGCCIIGLTIVQLLVASEYAATAFINFYTLFCIFGLQQVSQSLR